MKARLLRQWGGQYAGQIMTNVNEGDFPAGVAEFFDDDDPAIVEVREPGRLTQHPVAKDGSVAPLKGSDFAKAQEGKAKAVAAEHVASVRSQQDAIKDKAEEDRKSAEFEVKTQAAAAAGTPVPVKP